jgi:tRNA (guanine37-N1)-methyltransferase
MKNNKKVWTASVFTTIPEAYPGILSSSLSGKSLKKGIWKLNVVNIHEHLKKSNVPTDKKTFGGGSGMIMRSQIINSFLKKEFSKTQPEKLLYFSPKGKKISQRYIENLSKLDHIGLLCNRFEGIDQRILQNWKFEEISIGDFILSGGDVAAMAVIESTVRLIPNVLMNKNSLKEESFNSYLLEYNQYASPQNWLGFRIPTTLTSGNHMDINKWRLQTSKYITKTKRLDLWKKHLKTKIKNKIHQIKRNIP